MYIIVHCICGNPCKVDSALSGATTPCPACGRAMLVPLSDAKVAPVVPPAKVPQKITPMANPRAATRMAPAVKRVTCPSCKEECSAGVAVCPNCNAWLSAAPVVPVASQKDAIKDVLLDLDAHIADPMAQAEDRRLRGFPISIQTVIAGLLFAGCVLMIVAGAMSKSRDAGGMIAVGIVFGFIPGICLAVGLTNDYRANHILDAGSPSIACRNFFSALKTGRAAKAYIALIPTARVSGAAETLQFQNPGIPAHVGVWSITDVKSFKEYWKTIFTGPTLQTRTVAVKVRQMRTLSDDMAIVTMELSITNYPSLVTLLVFIGLLIAVIVIYAIQKKETRLVDKLMIKHNGQWYVAEAQLSGPLDQ